MRRSRRDGLGDARHVDGSTLAQREQGRYPPPAQGPVDIILDDGDATALSCPQDLPAPLDRHRRSRRVVIARRADERAQVVFFASCRKGFRIEAVGVERQPHERQAEELGDAADARIVELLGRDHSAANGDRRQRSQQGLLRSVADHEAVRICLDPDPGGPHGAGCTMPLEASKRRVVETTLELALMQQSAEPLAQVNLERAERGPVQHQVDERALGPSAGLSPFAAGRLAHIGAATHLAVDQADALGLAVGARDGADRDAQSIRQRSLGRQLRAGLQVALADVLLQRVDDCAIDRTVAPLNPRDPHPPHLQVQPAGSQTRARDGPRPSRREAAKTLCEPNCTAHRQANGAHLGTHAIDAL